MILQEALCRGKKRLQNAQIEEYEIDAWYLLEFVTGINRSSYYAHPKKELSSEEEIQYFLCIEERAKRIPLQHITKIQEFMGFEFEVNQHVLIPRQDTEVLVETVLSYVQPETSVLDMCTGSGCIIISLLKKCNIEGTAVDVSRDALNVAKRNAYNNKVDVTLVESDLFEKVEGTFDIIVSNPPYIKTAVISELQEEVKLYDPFIALDGKEDGLFFYRKIISESIEYLNDNGYLFFEIGYDQAFDVQKLMEVVGFTEIKTIRDLVGLDRVVTGRYNIAEK